MLLLLVVVEITVMQTERHAVLLYEEISAKNWSLSVPVQAVLLTSRNCHSHIDDMAAECNLTYQNRVHFWGKSKVNYRARYGQGDTKNGQHSI